MFIVTEAVKNDTGKKVRVQTCDFCGSLGEGHYFPGSHSGQPEYGEYCWFICNNCYRENYKLLPKPIEEELFIKED